MNLRQQLANAIQTLSALAYEIELLEKEKTELTGPQKTGKVIAAPVVPAVVKLPTGKGVDPALVAARKAKEEELKLAEEEMEPVDDGEEEVVQPRKVLKKPAAKGKKGKK